MEKDGDPINYRLGGMEIPVDSAVGKKAALTSMILTLHLMWKTGCISELHWV